MGITVTTYADTGNGTTLALATSTFTVGGFTMIGGPTQDIEALETSHLGTSTTKRYMPADLYEPGQLELELYFNGDTAASLPTPGSTPEIATLTYPNGATLTGAGFFTSISYPEVRNNQVMVSKAVFKYNGRANITDQTAGPVFAT